jgi:hypothetical protein
LKNLYGPGFKLFVNSHAKDTKRVCDYIESILPEGWNKIDCFATTTSYDFPPTPGYLATLFPEIERNQARVGILDWGVGQTTLEEVFINIISEADATPDARK